MTAPDDSTDETARPSTTPPPAEAADAPRASDVLGQALGGAARRAGIDPAGEKSTGHVVWAAMGGWRGVLESVLPGLVFIVVFTITMDPQSREGDLFGGDHPTCPP